MQRNQILNHFPKWFSPIFFLFLLCVTHSLEAQQQGPIRKAGRYAVYPDRIEQKPFEAKALSPKHITSTYQSQANLFVSPRVDFKFSINGKDNEMVSGTDHHFNCVSAGICETPLIEFGKQFNDTTTIPDGKYIEPDTRLMLRLDMRRVFAQFNEKGYFETFNGQKIFKEDFKGVYVAGNIAPLTWDFDNLQNHGHLQLTDDDGDHIYELTLTLNKKEDKKVTSSEWTLSADVGAYPQYKSDYVLHDAIYNLSLEEMIRAVEKDSTLRTGKEWAGVWTRDVSYSIILAMAILQPKVAQYSLMRKVKNGMVIQDTGTGGAYPVSTDRMIWAVAAYEIYKVTGDKKWLNTVYPIIKKSLEADLLNAVDAETGLVKGESSFLDWREQTYPTWMEPADIFESQCLGTNAVHYQAHTVLAIMAEELRDAPAAAKHRQAANSIKEAINKYLWMPDNGYYGQFLYGRQYKILSPRSEALGEALCVLFGIADENRAKVLTMRTPVNEFGIPCIYPQIPNIPPYHNNAVWPFVQAYWTMACAKAGNEYAVTESLSAILRPTAMFLTNKENFVAENGDFVGTQINSDNMLWSLSGNISMVYKVLFGIQYGAKELVFKPFVPKAFQGRRTLLNFKYRDAVLDIELIGYGNKIKSFVVDGRTLKSPVVVSSLKGHHKIKIQMQNNETGLGFNMSPDLWSPEAPAVMLSDNLEWKPVNGASRYRVIRNGKEIAMTTEAAFPLEGHGEYQVIALSSDGVESFASEPVLYLPKGISTVVQLEKQLPPSSRDYKGFTGSGFIETSIAKDSTITFEVEVPADGIYAVDFRYANGNGPVNTENKCAIRGLKLADKYIGPVVLPQRGTNEWSDWGFTNPVKVKLVKGSHTFTLAYEPHHLNMNGEINEAVIDYVRLIRAE